MTDRDAALLAILRATEDHRRSVRPFGRDDPAACLEWDTVQRHGPRIAGLIGGAASDAARKRFHRTLEALEVTGLVERSANAGRYFTHVRLTAAGEEAARGLAAAAPSRPG